MEGRISSCANPINILHICKAGPLIVIDISDNIVKADMSARRPHTRDIILDINIFIIMFPERNPYLAAPADF